MPAEDSVLVERLRAAGAIPIGKTNVPEFGMGSHSYNRVYGTTLNPYDTDQERGRVERWRRRRARGRAAADRRWQRSRRLAAQSGQLQQHRGAASDRGLDPDGARR